MKQKCGNIRTEVLDTKFRIKCEGQVIAENEFGCVQRLLRKNDKQKQLLASAEAYERAPISTCCFLSKTL